MGLCIVGGSGFIGSRLMRRLVQSKNINIQIVDKNRSSQFPDYVSIGDVGSLEDLRRSIVSGDPLINLAAEHRDNVKPSALYDQVNVEGARNICEVARERGITRIIFTSSVAVYGFAPLGTNENGKIAPFNNYGRTKWEAEEIYKEWQREDPEHRGLVIVRPTVVFGEQNRGNVYNLLKQIASGRFIMIGNGNNRKSMAYVENIAAFIEYSLSFGPGLHIYNYADKPDFSMLELVIYVNKLLNKSYKEKFKIPFFLGIIIGMIIDVFSWISGKQFPISAVRIRKFCANSVYESRIEETGFIPPVALLEAIENTISFEFIEDNNLHELFYSE